MRELDKMKEVQEKSQLIGEFVDEFLRGKGISLCMWQTPKNACGKKPCKKKHSTIWETDECKGHHHDSYCKNYPLEGHYPIRENILQLLAEFFGIDLKKVEEEKLKIIEELRKK